MILPSTLKNKNEWVFVGPMGPEVPDEFNHLPRLCVDGGAHFSKSMNIWIGDGDSYPHELTSDHIFKLPAEKDQSDLSCALGLFTDPHHYKFHFWGFLGGRRDHELFNLGESLSFLEKHQECQILFYGEDGKVQYHVLGYGQWKFSHRGVFSLGTLKKTEVKLTGNLHYPIRNVETLRPLSSLGLSNIGEGEMILETMGPVFLYFPEGK
jgi:thiamine pyrophosphokinase